jgi:hypothetical protein
VLNPVGLVREIGSEGFHYSTGHFGSQGNSPVFHAQWLWRSFGLALPMAAASLLARTVAVRRAAIVLLSFIASYYVFLSVFPVRFARNLLPVSGTIAAAAAIGVVVVCQHVAEACPRRVVAAVSVVVVVGAVLAVPIAGTASALGDIREDPWSETRAWIHDNVPPGSTIAIEAWTPYVDTDRYDLVKTNALGRNTLERYEELGVDYFVASEAMSQPFIDHPDESPTATRLYAQIFDEDCILYEVNGADQTFTVIKAPPC